MWGELGPILGGLGATLAALGAWRNGRGLRRGVKNIDHAVNNRPGESSLYELVAETRGDIRYLCHRMDAFETRLDRLDP